MTPEESRQFEVALRQVMACAYATAVTKGLWTQATASALRADLERKLLRVHSEVTALGVALRAGDVPSPEPGMDGYSAAENAAAHIVLRLMDICQHRGWDLPGAIVAKLCAYKTIPPPNRGAKP